MALRLNRYQRRCRHVVVTNGSVLVFGPTMRNVMADYPC
jgi:hypothetical protein